MIENGDIPLTNYCLIKFFYLRLWFSLFKLNYIVGAYKGLIIMINKLIFVDREIYNDIHDFLYACN